MTKYKLSIGYNTTPNTSTQGNDNEVAHAACRSVGAFSNGGSFGIVYKGDGEMCSLLEQPDDGKRLFPWKVRGKGYGTVPMITIGSTNPNSINLAGKIILLGKRVNIPLYFICKTSEIGTTRTCREFFSSKNSTTVLVPPISMPIVYVVSI